MNQNFTNWANSIEWEAVGVILLAHALKKKERRKWGGSEGRLSAGYEPEDVVQDVITKYIVKHCKDDSHSISQEELIKILRKKVVNRLKDLSGLHCNTLGTESLDQTEKDFPVELDSTFDHGAFELDLLQVLDDEPDLLELYSDLYDHELKPIEIRKKRDISEQEYQNNVRKLRRRIEPLLTKHNIIRHHARGSKKNDPSAQRAGQQFV